MIRVIDYGLGNVQAFISVFNELGYSANRARNVEDLEDADRLILPGVGHFDHAMEQLNRSNLRDELERLVLNKAIPILGVCVGMQMLANFSEEGNQKGLGWIGGQVRRFPKASLNSSLTIPHMGWNEIRFQKDNPLFKTGFKKEARFYFLHSFYFEVSNEKDISAYCDYGLKFGATVSSGHIHGVQFHPEKSHGFGMKLLKNFADFG